MSGEKAQQQQPPGSLTPATIGVAATLPPMTPLARQFHMGSGPPRPAATSGASSTATTSSDGSGGPTQLQISSPGKRGKKASRPKGAARVGSSQPSGNSVSSASSASAVQPSRSEAETSVRLSESAVAAASAIVDQEDAAAKAAALKQQERLAAEQSGEVDVNVDGSSSTKVQNSAREQPLHTTKSQDQALDQLGAQPASLRPTHRLRGLRAFLRNYAGDVALALSFLMDACLLVPGVAAIAAAGNPVEPLSQALVGTGNDGLVELLNANGPGIGRILARAGVSLAGDLLCFAAPAPILAGVALAFVHWVCTKPEGRRLTTEARLNFSSLVIVSMGSVVGFGTGIHLGLKWKDDHDAMRNLLRQPVSELPNACRIEDLGASTSLACVPAVSPAFIARQVVPQLQDRYLDLPVINPSVLLLLINAGIIFLMLLLRVCRRACSSFGARGERQPLIPAGIEQSNYYSRLPAVEEVASLPPRGGIPVMNLKAGHELRKAPHGETGELVVSAGTSSSGQAAQVDEPPIDPSVLAPGASRLGSVNASPASGSGEEPPPAEAKGRGCIML